MHNRKASIRFSSCAAPRRLIVLSKTQSGLLVCYENRLDRIHRTDIPPLIAAVDFRLLILTTVISFEAPVFHQDTPTVLKLYRVRVTPNGFRQQFA